MKVNRVEYGNVIYKTHYLWLDGQFVSSNLATKRYGGYIIPPNGCLLVDNNEIRIDVSRLPSPHSWPLRTSQHGAAAGARRADGDGKRFTLQMLSSELAKHSLGVFSKGPIFEVDAYILTSKGRKK